MKLDIKVTQAERHTLQQLSRKHRHQDLRNRGLGLLLLSEGRGAYDIAEELEVSAKSVYNWAHAWQNKGLSGLLTGHIGGRPRALSDDMIATAAQAARSESMTLKQIADHIQAAHNKALPCCLETLSRSLKDAGFSYKRGRYSLKKNDANKNLP